MRNYAVFLRQLHRNFRDLGPRDFARKLLQQLKQQFARKEFLFTLDCRQCSAQWAKVPADFTMAKYEQRENVPVEILDEIRTRISKPEMSREDAEFHLERTLAFFAQGGTLWVARLEGYSAGFLWSFRAQDDFQPHFPPFPIAPGEAVLISGYAFPQVRGKGTIPNLIRYTASELAKSGVTRLYVTCRVWNEASRRCILKGGFEPVGVFRAARVFSRWLVLWQNRNEAADLLYISPESSTQQTSSTSIQNK